MSNTLADLRIELKVSLMLPGELGVFATSPIATGERFIDDQTLPSEDTLLTFAQIKTLPSFYKEKIHHFSVERDGGYLIPIGVDYNELGTSWYLNHSCDGNVGFDEEGNFIAIRDIQAGEELLYDYGLIEGGAYRLECKCGSKNCRNVITGSDWKDPSFRAAKGAYLYPDLR